MLDGKQYALKSPIGKNHSVVFVKLTDSALKAIEDYALAVSKVITIPTRKCDESDRNKKDHFHEDISTNRQFFNFSIKDTQNDGILECVKQTNSILSMESLGKILLRMQIHANDDVYQKTRVKMAVVAEQEQKKYNTKVINSSDISGRKVKRPINSKLTPHNNSNLSYKNNCNGSFMNNPSSMGPSNSLFGKQQGHLNRFNKYSNSCNSLNNSSFNSSSVAKTNCGNSTQSSENYRKTRESLLQLLSARSYKINELILRVQDRLKESFDKSLLLNILSSIATFKDGVYHLIDTSSATDDFANDSDIKRSNGSNQSDVSTASSSTSSNNKSSSITINNGSGISPLSDSSARSLPSPNSQNASPNMRSSNSSTNNSPYSTIRNSIKRNQDSFNITSNSNSKKFKGDDHNSRFHSAKSLHSNSNPSYSNGGSINCYSPFEKMSTHSNDDSNESHEFRQTNSNVNISHSNNDFKSSNSCLNDQKKSKVAINEIELNGERDASNSFGNQNVTASTNQSNQRHYCSNDSGSMHSSPNSSPDSGISHVGGNNLNSSDSNLNHDLEEYLSKYSKVQNEIQLNQYKNDFNQEFPEYKKLYEYVDSVSRQFEELKEMINTKEEESAEWHDLIKQIFEKYDEVKNRSKYQKMQKRLVFLHYKLLHIKNLINEYYLNNASGKILPTSVNKCDSNNSLRSNPESTKS
ncbi:RNA polymerase II elongation factor ELL2-like protein [Sarcoptes scabiei]|uniref:RNA polymerase II elongation factor ELL2-like protein n=2 Tax=Sarcoptes scabiei TaxID=52283 RepID=A0A132ABA5_SARSC|nr:RNA polymerase II elongation factor ELL2-like protein [Sarcoptes scabiei]